MKNESIFNLVKPTSLSDALFYIQLYTMIFCLNLFVGVDFIKRHGLSPFFILSFVACILCFGIASDIVKQVKEQYTKKDEVTDEDK